MTESLNVTDAQSRAVQKTPNRVSLEYIESRIKGVEYINPDCLPSMTIAVVSYENGSTFIGKSAPADPDNYDKPLGEKFAYEEAVRQIWPMEGFALREGLHKSQ